MPMSTHVPLGTIFPVLEDKPKRRVIHPCNGNWLVMVLQSASQYQAVAAFCKQEDAQAFKRLLKKQAKKTQKMRVPDGPGS